MSDSQHACIDESSAGVESAVTRDHGFWWCIASVVALTGFMYWPVRSFEFLNWDDPWYVINNPYLLSWSPQNLWAIGTEVINRNYSPMIIYTLLIEYTLFGLEPAGYHVVNVLLHALNAALVFVLISRLASSRSVGWATAAVFAVHPVQIESVAWISSIKGLVVGAFILAHLICWMRPQRTGKQEFWGLAFFALALLSKALTVVVPAIVLLYDTLVCRKKFSESLARQFVPGMLSLWMLLTTMGAQVSSLGGTRGHMAMSKLQIMAVDSVVLWKYVANLVYPVDLCVLYNPPVSAIAGQVFVAIVAWIAIAAAIWRVRRSYPLIVLAAVSWLLLLLPVLNLTPITTLMNDRYLYMPSIPFFAVVFAGLRSLSLRLLEKARVTDHEVAKSRLLRNGWLVGPAAAVVLLFAASRTYLPVWSNDRALWQHASGRTPDLPVVQIQYAMMLHNHGLDTDAVAVLADTLVELNPDPLDVERIVRMIGEWGPDDS